MKMVLGNLLLKGGFTGTVGFCKIEIKMWTYIEIYIYIYHNYHV
jgi:hypothetical protein